MVADFRLQGGQQAALFSALMQRRKQGRAPLNTALTGYDLLALRSTVIVGTIFQRRTAMQPEAEDIGTVRREMLYLLDQQMEALNSPLSLTDEKLRECYNRQVRVQELREKLQASSSAEQNVQAIPVERLGAAGTMPTSMSQVQFASLDTAA
jgi:hypothetical protein